MENKTKEVTSKSYSLRDPDGNWLGQVVLTSDGMFASVTDWGNFSYAWRHYGEDFREFICNLNTNYFADKLVTGMAYTARSKQIEASIKRFTEKILPPLQQVLKEELEKE